MLAPCTLLSGSICCVQLKYLSKTKPMNIIYVDTLNNSISLIHVTQFGKQSWVHPTIEYHETVIYDMQSVLC